MCPAIAHTPWPGQAEIGVPQQFSLRQIPVATSGSSLAVTEDMADDRPEPGSAASQHIIFVEELAANTSYLVMGIFARSSS